MEGFGAFLNERRVRSVSSLMGGLCYLAVFIFVAGLFLSLIGRQTFTLRVPGGTYDSAIYSEENHEHGSNGPVAGLEDGIYVTVGRGVIGFATRAGLFGDLFPSLAFIVAAYIIHYGVGLQTEADHTL